MQIEHDVDRERADAEAKVRRVVRKAERAIRFFKDAAFDRGGLGQKATDGREHERPERLPRTVSLKVQAGRQTGQVRASRFATCTHGNGQKSEPDLLSGRSKSAGSSRSRHSVKSYRTHS